MKSLKHGKNISKPEITNISEHGFWIYFNGKEYFLPLEHFPWFKKATVQQISKVELWHNDHLYWPSLDVDLSFNIIEHPQTYKLVCRQ